MQDGRRGTDVMVIACIVIDPFLGFYRRCDCDLVVKWCALQMSRYIGYKNKQENRVNNKE
jgi:hypothetical protein